MIWLHPTTLAVPPRLRYSTNHNHPYDPYLILFCVAAHIQQYNLMSCSADRPLHLSTLENLYGNLQYKTKGINVSTCYFLCLVGISCMSLFWVAFAGTIFMWNIYSLLLWNLHKCLPCSMPMWLMLSCCTVMDCSCASIISQMLFIANPSIIASGTLNVH